MEHIQVFAISGPNGEPIATPSICSCKSPLNWKSWSLVPIVSSSIRSPSQMLSLCVLLNQFNNTHKSFTVAWNASTNKSQTLYRTAQTWESKRRFISLFRITSQVFVYFHWTVWNLFFCWVIVKTIYNLVFNTTQHQGSSRYQTLLICYPLESFYLHSGRNLMQEARDYITCRLKM